MEVARLAHAGADPKIVHAKASMARLFVSEATCRYADRAVQIFGGRGYMRTNVAERSSGSCGSTGSGRAPARSSG